jgi:hypothetical protein
MASVPEISVVRVPSPAEGVAADAAARASSGAFAPFEIPRPTGRSPVTLAILAVLAGIGSMALGALAVLSATNSPGSEPTRAATTPAPAASGVPGAERRALALLAKPSTERIVLRGSGGRLVLVVGSGGRAALLVHGRPSSAGPTFAWVIRDRRAVRAARIAGSTRAVFLAAPVGRGDSVVVAPDRAAALRPGPGRLVATRG